MTSITVRPRPFIRTRLFLIATGLVASATLAAAQTASTAADGSVPTPRPINPATNTSNPSTRAGQLQNPFLGSTPQPASDTALTISLADAVRRGLQYNLGSDRRVHVERRRTGHPAPRAVFAAPDCERARREGLGRAEPARSRTDTARPAIDHREFRLHGRSRRRHPVDLQRRVAESLQVRCGNGTGLRAERA